MNAKVQEANSISFPLWYIHQRRHLSVLISDGNRSASHGAIYPKTMTTGSPAGWAIAHSNLSLGALHVAEPYRRCKQNGASDNDESISVGRLAVIVMGPKLIDAQRQALRHIGVKDDLPTPYFADTEMHKGPARMFFEAVGFRGCLLRTWGSITLNENER